MLKWDEEKMKRSRMKNTKNRDSKEKKLTTFLKILIWKVIKLKNVSGQKFMPQNLYRTHLWAGVKECFNLTELCSYCTQWENLSNFNFFGNIKNPCKMLVGNWEL